MPTVLESLNAGLLRAFADDERVLLLGEDVLDPYGGAFKVTRGLSSAYPNRVLTTPISEAGIVGVAAGMALRGLRPVVEIMFGDFVTLCADQLINHAAKFRWMYGDGLAEHAPVHVPMVVRTPMGGRRGYGPTHSQTLEKLFLGVPGLRVLAPCHFGDPGELLYRAILETEDPVLFIENKLQYLLQTPDLSEFSLQADDEIPQAPTYRLALRDAPPAAVTLTAYGYIAELARQAMLKLAYEHEIFTELLVPTSLQPFSMKLLGESIRQTGRLLALEEGTASLGWGAEIVARAAEGAGSALKVARRLGAAEIPVPASGPLEDEALPNLTAIVQNVQVMV